MGSLCSARKAVFDSEAERSREIDKMSIACSPGNASAPLHLLSSYGGWGITPDSAELLWEHLIYYQ